MPGELEAPLEKKYRFLPIAVALSGAICFANKAWAKRWCDKSKRNLQGCHMFLFASFVSRSSKIKKYMFGSQTLRPVLEATCIRKTKNCLDLKFEAEMPNSLNQTGYICETEHKHLL